MASTLRSIALALSLVLACGCQKIFGDFSIAPAPAEEPASVLGTACEPGAYRCTNEVLETCNDERSGFVVAETCADPAACNLNARTCRPCVPGEWMCRDNVLESCTNELTWQLKATCDTPALCNVAPNRTSGSCDPAICEAGVHDCQGANLVRCSAGRDRWEAVALCATPELCDETYADELARSGARGECRPPVCPPDAFRCDGATLRHCAIDRTAWEDAAECDSADLCNVARGACAACALGDVECNGAELRRCTPSGGWETLATCDAVALCDAEAGSCGTAECNDPEALRCGSGGVPVLERCSEALRWEVVEACPTVELCSVAAGRCLPPACIADATRCLGNRLERCTSDLTRWELVATCADGEICAADAGCMQGTCTEGNVRCNDSSLERCVSGRYEEVERCATAILCNADSTSCTAPVCSAGESMCRDSSIIEKCRPGREDFGEFLTCSDGSTCDASPSPDTGQAKCVFCTANSYECDGTDLLRCSSNGQDLQRVSTCPGCVVTGGIPSSCD